MPSKFRKIIGRAMRTDFKGMMLNDNNIKYYIGIHIISLLIMILILGP
jgi:hypothetical protein